MNSDTVLYDPFTHTVADDPYPIYRQLREEHPVYCCEQRGCWVLSRFEDVQPAARNWELFSNEGGVDLDQPAHYLGRGDFLDSDPPLHDRLRGVLHEHFKPKALAALEGAVRRRVEGLVAPLVARGEGDLAAELAFPLPMQTILDLMGLSGDEAGVYGRLLQAAVERIPGSEETPPHARAAMAELEGRVSEAIEARRKAPQDDLLTIIAKAEAAGMMTAEEIPGMCLLLLIAGWETTAGLLSSSLLHLARHPEQRALLVDRPELVPRAVEEVLRFDAPVQHLARLTTARVELHGVEIDEGERVLLLWGAANRDTRRWERGEEFDVLREQKRNIAFGEGIHHCLGAPLARMEARIALELLLPQAPHYEIVGDVTRFHAHQVRGLEHLPASL